MARLRKNDNHRSIRAMRSARLDTLRDDIAALKEDAATLKDDLVEYAADSAKIGVRTAGSAVRGLSDRASDVKSKGVELVQARPFTSALIALGVGAVLLKLLAARR